MKQEIVIRHKGTHEAVKSINTRGRIRNKIDDAIIGLFKQLNHEQFYIDDSQTYRADQNNEQA